MCVCGGDPTDAGASDVSELDARELDARELPDVGPAEPSHDVDILFMVDNSNSMAEEQTSLIQALPELVRALATGDVDGDGVAESRAAATLHVGVVTPDMGAGPSRDTPTCAAGLGDDGLLRSRSRDTTAPCMATYPSGIFEFDGARHEPIEFASTVSCVLNIGTGGCGFEQQLEAPLKALTPESAHTWTAPGYLPPRFLDASGEPDAESGHADDAHTGFLRRDSVLAVVLLTDEEDCSVQDYGLFALDDPRFEDTPLNVRCYTFAAPTDDVLHPIERYIDGFVGLRTHPENLVFAAIVGIPPAVEPASDPPDFEAILADPAMMWRPTSDGTNAMPSCSSVNGVAYPPTRIVRVGQGLSERGASVTLHSICNESLTSASRSIVTHIAERLAP